MPQAYSVEALEAAVVKIYVAISLVEITNESVVLRLLKAFIQTTISSILMMISRSLII